MNYKVIYAVILLLLAINSCNTADTIKIKTPNENFLTVEIAMNQETRTRGLMHRKSLAKNNGMLFIFEDNTIKNFWMKNTSIPLSIAFIDFKGQVVKVSDMHPFSLDIISSEVAVKYALEINKGELSRLGIHKGSSFNIREILNKIK